MKRLAGKTALVTGGNRGIGRAIVERFASEGAAVIIFGRKAADNEAVETETAARYGTAVKSYVVDVSDKESVAAGVKAALADFDHVDILVNNAGVCHLSTPFEDLADDTWQATLGVNLYGTVNVTKALIPVLKKNPNGGKIINIASLAGEVGGIATSADYVASKSAIQGITRSLARELGPHHINVNAIAPGFVETKMTEEMKINLGSIPLRSVAQPEDIAAAAAFVSVKFFSVNYLTCDVIEFPALCFLTNSV